jgi:DNA-binding NarL/FixJ family response regulator
VPRSTASVRLAVISDDQALAGRVMSGLERDGLVVRLEAAGRDASALAAAERRPTVVVVAVQDTAEDVVRQARRWVPNAAVIVILFATGHGGASRLLSVGADALLLDRDVDAAVAVAVRAVGAGQSSVPSELRHLIQPMALSHRERQILGLAVAGLTNAQIAARLFIAESTVKTHLSSAFRRLGVHSRREAAAMVFASDEMLRRSVLTTLRLSHALEPQKEAR